MLYAYHSLKIIKKTVQYFTLLEALHVHGLCNLFHLVISINQYIKIFVVCVSVCDGCGRGSNEFAGRVQNYRVPCAK